MKLALGAVVVVAGLLLADSASACSVPRIRTFHNQTVEGQMTVRSGKRCSIVFRSAGPTETHAIAQRPSHGTLQVGSIGRITYQSRAGYVGADEFTYVRRGRDKFNNSSVRTVHVIVKVTR